MRPKLRNRVPVLASGCLSLLFPWGAMAESAHCDLAAASGNLHAARHSGDCRVSDRAFDRTVLTVHASYRRGGFQGGSVHPHAGLAIEIFPNGEQMSEWLADHRGNPSEDDREILQLRVSQMLPYEYINGTGVDRVLLLMNDGGFERRCYLLALGRKTRGQEWVEITHLVAVRRDRVSREHPDSVLGSTGMEALLKLPRRASYADYLAVERHSEYRHEFIDGVIVAMAGGFDEHNAIAGRLAMLLGQRTEKGCRYYTSDQRFWIPGRARGRYSDGSIICGKPEHPPHDDQATTNPVVVIEVLSPSSEGDDEGDKRLDFQSLASVQAYVLVAQDERSVRVYRRSADGHWPTDAQSCGRGAVVELPAMTSLIGVDEIYDDILDADGRSLLR